MYKINDFFFQVLIHFHPRNPYQQMKVNKFNAVKWCLFLKAATKLNLSVSRSRHVLDASALKGHCHGHFNAFFMLLGQFWDKATA